MAFMFYLAKAFDQNIAYWDVNAVLSHTAFSEGSLLRAESLPNFNP